MAAEHGIRRHLLATCRASHFILHGSVLCGNCGKLCIQIIDTGDLVCKLGFVCGTGLLGLVNEAAKLLIALRNLAVQLGHIDAQLGHIHKLACHFAYGLCSGFCVDNNIIKNSHNKFSFCDLETEP